jgi:hypothetical protein
MSYRLSQVFDPRFLRANGRLLVDAINAVVELEQRGTDSVGDGLAEWLKRGRVWTKIRRACCRKKITRTLHGVT